MPATVPAAISAIAQKMGGEHHLAILHVEIEAFDEPGNRFFVFVAHMRADVKCEV